MSLSLLLPAGLAALAALLLPLLVHLARRSTPRPVVFAALRWLQARPQPRRRYRFEEILLLVLRLLLLAALALLLAEPVLSGLPDRTPRVLVAPGVDIGAARRELDRPEARWHQLAPGLPPLQDGAAPPPAQAAATSHSLSSLLREADATLPAGTPLTVLVPAVIRDADAERPVLSRPVEWRVVPTSGSIARTPPSSAAAPRLAVRHAPDRTAALRYLRAAGIAWQVANRQGGPPVPPARKPPAPVVVGTTFEPLPEERRHLVWLVPGPLPETIRDWIRAGGTALLAADTTAPGLAEAAVVWRDAKGPLARGARLGEGRILQLQRPLVPARMPVLLEPDFPEQLRRLLVDAPPPSPSWVDAQAHAPRTGLPGWPPAARPLAPWLAMLVALLFLLERWVASGPRRGAAS